MKKIFLYFLLCSFCHESAAQLIPTKTPAKKPASQPAPSNNKNKPKPKAAEPAEKPAEVAKVEKQGIILITSDVNAELYVNGALKDEIKAGDNYTLKLPKGTHNIKVESLNFDIAETIENFKVETGEELKPWYILMKDKEVEIWNNRLSKLLIDALVGFVRAENYYDKDDIENRFTVDIKNGELNYTLTTTRNPNAKLITLKSTTVKQTFYKIRPENIQRFQLETIQRPYTRFYGTTVLLKIYGAVSEKAGTYGQSKAIDAMSIPLKTGTGETLMKELELLLERKPTVYIK